MTIHVDHTIVPARKKVAAAKLLAELLGVAWAASGPGPGTFAPVYVNDGLTPDFVDTDEEFPICHFCFRVAPEDFEGILARIRAKGAPYRSTVHGPTDMKVNTDLRGPLVYWNEPEGHYLEMLTVTDVDVRLLDPVTAIAHVRWTMDGAKVPPGAPESPRQGIQLQVLRKDGGRWQIAGFQNTNSVPEAPFPRGPPPAPTIKP